MLLIENVSKDYGAHSVLDGVSLEVGAGQIVGLIGSNGAGKTTLISIAAGLITPGEGRVLVGDGVRAPVDATRHPRRAARLIGLAPQELGVYPMLSVEQNLAVFADLAGLDRADSRRRVAEVVEALDLGPQVHQRADTLSGGQARRLHTGMALLHRPAVLFLDEPTVGADVAARRAILAVVRELAAAGTAVVYTTHYLGELADLGASVAILHGGRIALTGTVAEVVDAHASPTVAILTSGAEPHLAGWTATAVGAGVTRWEAPRAGVGLQKGDHRAVLAGALAALGASTTLEGVEVAPASLETAFLALTGHTLATPSTEEVRHVALA